MPALPIPHHVERLAPYVPGKPLHALRRELGLTELISLASNENPLGPSPLAREAIRAAAEGVHLYPDSSNHDLVHRLAEHLGVGPEVLFLGQGSDEIIHLLVRTFTTPADETLLFKGSFVAFRAALQTQNRWFTEVDRRADQGHDLDALAASITQRTRLIFLANPDNPMGTAFSRRELERFLERVPDDVLVVLDEAYFEYVDWSEYPNGLEYLRDRENLVVLRTFSKIYGLAALRLGYGVMAPRLVRYLQRMRLPFNISSVAQAAGIAALDDSEHVRRSRDANRTGLRALTAGLRAHGVTVPESRANFVFADFQRAAAPIAEHLLRHGLMTRWLGPNGYPEALRISVGLPQQIDRVLHLLASAP